MFKKIFFLLDKNEIKFLFIASVFLLLGIFLEMLSFVIIIPVFNLIFLNDFSDNFLLNLFFTDIGALENNKLKVIILVIMLLIFFIKNTYLIVFNYFNRKFFYDLNMRLSTNLFTLYLKQNYFFFFKKQVR